MNHALSGCDSYTKNWRRHNYPLLRTSLSRRRRAVSSQCCGWTIIKGEPTTFGLLIDWLDTAKIGCRILSVSA